MRFTLQREVLLKPLQQVVNVVERRQTMPVLANLLVSVKDNVLSVTASDTEVELVARCNLDGAEDGETTIPARKWFDIVRALPDGSQVTVKLNGDRITVSAGRSRFVLSTLPAEDFPSSDELEVVERVSLTESVVKELIERTAFAMAQQDVRFYLNGLLFDLSESNLRCVATDGHRLALCEAAIPTGAQSRKQIILPRKGVLELQRLLEGSDVELELELGRSHVRARRSDVMFTSKLIDGRFPDYEAVIPIGADKLVKVDRELLRSALQRASILSNEKYKGVKLEVSPDQLRVTAHNPEQEEATEEIEAETPVDGVAIGFNVGYLMEAIAALRGEHIILQLRDANSSALVREVDSEACRHVVMPLRL
ncbi:DNA polymerase III subunit beta [Pseudomarimonas arenosa]|uniref:Beta sliding clamp n=1 Tax=Pseudomarimonas arenosa TaxID=2774145 RepID=A0AAW3ZKV4_9GAMM|nr:DNA polymerase III subunit beta [Pseudomarimonas arenosa]MBD8526358.1 DNA polymerase III subunit beta [Pseudomarimonas arenosa]